MSTALEDAWGAFTRRDWAVARDRFAEAVDEDASAAAVEGLGRSLWWLGDPDAALTDCERAVEETRGLLQGLEDRPGALPSMVALHLAAGELDLAAQRVEHRLEAAQGDDLN